MIQRILRTFAGLAGLGFLALGLMLLLMPGAQTGRFAVLPTGNAGLSTMRGDLGGLFLSMAFFSLLGAVRGSNRWLAVPAVLLGFIILGRLVNLILDGSSSASTQSMALEAILDAILLATILSLRQRGPAGFSAGFAIAISALLPIALSTAWLFQRQLGLMLIKRNLDQTLQNQLLPSLPDGLHAGLCGSGSPLPDAKRAAPCLFVIAGKRLYIVDAGEGSARKLALLGIPPAAIEAILLTHFHSDHIGGLGDMMLQRWAGGSHTDPTPVIGPQGVESVVRGFNEAYGLDKGYRIANHGEVTMPPSGSGGIAHPFILEVGSNAGQVVLQKDGLTITAFPVAHMPVFPASGYRFDYHGRSVVISGDTAPSQTVAKYSRGADVLFHEGLQTTMVALVHDASVRRNLTSVAKIMADIPSYHTTPEDAARIAQQAGVRYLVFYHTIPALPVEYLNAAFLGDAPKIFKGPITVGKDGTMVSLTPGNSAVTLRELP